MAAHPLPKFREMTGGQRERISDIELAGQARDGNREAFAELWRRHAVAGRAIARSITSSIEPDDLVAEAYGKIYALIKAGGGPTGAFRPYLAATIRNLATSIGRSRREIAIDFADELVDDTTSDEARMRQLDRDLATAAFRELPERWQQALWYSEVEGMSVGDCAEIFGIKPTAMAMLTFRAREGLRDAWIQAHIKTLEPGSEHEWAVERLGAHARGRLSKRDTARLRNHLTDCESCSEFADEAHFAASRLAGCLLPPLLGAGAAAAYVQEIADGATAANAATEAAVLSTSWSPRGPLHNSLQQLQSIVGSSALVTLALATGATVVDALPPTSPNVLNEQLKAPEPSSAALPTSDASAKVDRLTVDVDLGRLGLFYPKFSGAALPDSTVRIASLSEVIAEVPVDGSGHWASRQLDRIPSGTLTIENVADGSVVGSVSADVDLESPTLSADRSGGSVTLTVRGMPGAGIAVTSIASTRSATISASILDRAGVWSATFEALPDADEFTVRYAEGKRFGPSSSAHPTR
jgi:RNA polymerase sigma factor (sigma-70 family)